MSKLVIIEDDELLRTALADKFEKSGYNVEQAGDGIEGLAKIIRFKPDLVFVDILMPKKSGIELIRDIQKDPKLRSIKIAVISNLDDPVSRGKTRELGVEHYLVKADHTPREMVEIADSIIKG